VRSGTFAEEAFGKQQVAEKTVLHRGCASWLHRGKVWQDNPIGE
jgi:hypothetical protein